MRNPPGRYKDADPAHRAFGRSADSSLLRKRRYDAGGPVQMMAHHEQSETVQNERGEWVNVYGKNTPQAGRQLPDTPTYPSVDEAVDAARKRSEDYGREHPEHEDPEEE